MNLLDHAGRHNRAVGFVAGITGGFRIRFCAMQGCGVRYRGHPIGSSAFARIVFLARGKRQSGKSSDRQCSFHVSTDYWSLRYKKSGNELLDCTGCEVKKKAAFYEAASAIRSLDLAGLNHAGGVGVHVLTGFFGIRLGVVNSGGLACKAGTTGCVHRADAGVIFFARGQGQADKYCNDQCFFHVKGF